jgi:hypothetical protein
MVRLIAALMASLGALVACSSAPAAAPTALPDDAVVTYAFHDASVPPSYHRSVTLTVTKDQAHIVVDSYGQVLADVTAAVPAAAWSTMSGQVAQLRATQVASPDAGCAGGTSIDLTVASGGDDIVSLAPQMCGGSNAKAGRAIDAWVAPVRNLFPATRELAPS